MSRLWACRLVLVGVIAIISEVDAGAGTPPRITYLGAFPGYSTTARGINDAGEIVGEKSRGISENSFESHGLLWRKDASGNYYSTEIGELTDFPNSYPRSINNIGQIGGWAEVVDLSVMTTPPSQAVMWEKDGSGAHVPTDLGTPYGFWYSETAMGGEGGHVLNELGQIAGGAALFWSGPMHACLWAEPGLSPPVELSPPASSTSFKAYGVNSAGFVVGASPLAGRAILWQKDAAGSYSQVELPMPVGGQRAVAHDINDSGQIVGLVDRWAVVWEKSASGDYELRFLESLPGATSSRANAINNSGDVIGRIAVGVSGHAVLWQRDALGEWIPLDLATFPGITSSTAYGINERGQIVGSASYHDANTNTTLGYAVLWELADVTPPTIADASASPGVLWPPNHKLVDVTVSYEATDDSGSVACSLGPVTSNEPLTPADWRIVDDHALQLRSERYGGGNGRVYSIPIQCSDPSGNVVSQPVVVTVPHDQRR